MVDKGFNKWAMKEISVWLLHLGALISFIYSFWAGSSWIIEGIWQQQALLTVQIKYIIIAIFLELCAIGTKNVGR